jgi:DNA-binding transcriptional ArsR family regulator
MTNAVIILTFFTTIYCVVAVRNGLEAFRDGLIIKESFILFYMSLFVTFVVTNRTPFSAGVRYFVRSSLLCFGATAFCFRLLIGRCYRLWIPERMLRFCSEKLLHQGLMFITSHCVPTGRAPILQSLRGAVAPDGQAAGNEGRLMSIHTSDISGKKEEGGPVYCPDVPSDGNIEEMMRALADKNRLRIFREVAEKSLVTESLEFLLAVQKYREESATTLVSRSSDINDSLREKAKKIFSNHIQVSSPQEVNISATLRTKIEKSLRGWETRTPIFSYSRALEVLEEGTNGQRFHVFEAAFQEVSVMLYQNIWSKFRVAETQSMAAAADGHQHSTAEIRSATPSLRMGLGRTSNSGQPNPLNVNTKDSFLNV